MDRLAIDSKILLALGFPMLVIKSDDLQPFLGHLIGSEFAQACQHTHPPPVGRYSIEDGEGVHRYTGLDPYPSAHVIP